MSDEAKLDRLTRLRPVFITLIALAIGGVLMLVGGRWDWVEGWLLAGASVVLLVGSSLWAARYAPGQSRERVQAVARPGNWHERLILMWVPILLIAVVVVAALDGGRFRWSRVPLWLEAVGFVLIACYFALNLWAAGVNPFLSAAARVQTERGHFVVKSGPYRLIRHPMYLGLCLMGVGIPLALGSWWALIPGGIFVATFVYRTWQEDRLLLANLPGYADYVRETRYRLIPGVW